MTATKLKLSINGPFWVLQSSEDRATVYIGEGTRIHAVKSDIPVKLAVGTANHLNDVMRQSPEVLMLPPG